MRATPSSKTAPIFSGAGVLLCGLLLAVCSAAAVYLCYLRGWLLYYGDAECHLDIVRRVFHSGPAAINATALCALNPNLVYIQATPMTEPMFFGFLATLLYFTVR